MTNESALLTVFGVKNYNFNKISSNWRLVRFELLRAVGSPEDNFGLTDEERQEHLKMPFHPLYCWLGAQDFMGCRSHGQPDYCYRGDCLTVMACPLRKQRIDTFT
jgi:hypothetical protein